MRAPRDRLGVNEMLSREDNDLLCRIGPGTLMGDFVRQYWIPFLPSRDLPHSDGQPIKIRLLGEDLVAFRDTNGAVGLVDENCPHRGANLFWARNEECATPQGCRNHLHAERLRPRRERGADRTPYAYQAG
ncbi:MAG TPA: Rieske 2Fe-2S domain-containing protein [Chloroflexota bacterium]|nr:Rieske 2Fe-2S domain-containing protein [Chloroflexota bacterium]